MDRASTRTSPSGRGRQAGFCRSTGHPGVACTMPEISAAEPDGRAAFAGAGRTPQAAVTSTRPGPAAATRPAGQAIASCSSRELGRSAGAIGSRIALGGPALDARYGEPGQMVGLRRRGGPILGQCVAPMYARPEQERPMVEGTALDAPIAAVTVFMDGARVRRRGTVSVEPGLRRAVIRDLPPSVDPASVRVAARGRDLALLNVEVHHGYRTDPCARRPRGCGRRSTDAAMPSRRLTTRTPPNRRAWPSWITCPRRPPRRWRGR